MFHTTEGYSGMAAVDWMREALLTLGTVPDLPSDADGMQGSMVPVMRSKVWQGVMQNSGGPLFVATGSSRAQVALNPSNLHYAYAADYERHEANVAETIDLPEFKGSVLRSLKVLCRSASRERLEFLPSPDARQLYKLMIKIVLIRQLSESPYMAAQYREMLRYGAQQAAFRTGVVSDARSALLTLIDATAKNHNVKVDAQNSSDRQAAQMMVYQENKSRDDAAAADLARKREESRRMQSEIDMQIATNVSAKLAADTREVITKLTTAKLERTDADRQYAEAQTYSQTVVKTQNQAVWERNATESAQKRYMASRDMAAELEEQVATVRARMEQNVAELDAQRALAETTAASSRSQVSAVLNQTASASANVLKLKQAQEDLRAAYNELMTRKSDADFQADADRREIGRILAQIKELSGDYDDPNGALIQMQSSLAQITDNITRYDDQTKADLVRDVKNKACLGQPAAPAAAAPAAAASAGYAANGTLRTTPLNDNGGDYGSAAVYLNRHTVDCGGDAIQRFQLKSQGSSKYQYEFACGSGEGGEKSAQRTPASDFGPRNGKLAFLDRQNPDCGPGAVLSSFRLASDAKQWWYEYSCVASPTPLQCRDVTTPWSDIGTDEGKSAFLDRHDVACGADEALGGFKLQRNGKTASYSYRCCKK